MTTASRPAQLCTWAGLVLTLALITYVRCRLAAMPLERDEGEYAYSGQLMLRGVPPYAAAYNMKFPGVYAAYALILKTFGQTPTGIHLGTLVVNAANIVMLFFLMRRLWNHWAALAGSLIFALMTIDMNSLGMAGHATHFVVLFELAGLLVLTRGPSQINLSSQPFWKYFLAGILLGMCIVMKQPGAAFVGFAFAWMAIQQRRVIPRWSWSLVAGAVVPLVVMFLCLWHAGVFGRFWFWTFDYARFYGFETSITQVPWILLTQVITLTRDSFGLWGLSIAGLILGWTVKSQRSAMAFISVLAVFSFLATSAGFYYRTHYFILLMPAAAMLGAAGLSAVATHLNRLNPSLGAPVAAILCVLVCATLLIRQRHFFFEMTPAAACRQVYTTEIFAESPAAAEYLTSHTNPSDSIAVFGSEPQIYFYAHRPSATGYILTYALLEIQPYALQMQREMAAEISAARPKYIVVVNEYGSWAVDSRSEGWIFDWFSEYKKKYELVKTFEVWADRQAYYDRGEITRLPSARSSLLILRRIDG